MTAPRHPTPPSKAELDNRSRQLDPEHDTYWRSRGMEKRPERADGQATPGGRTKP